MKLLSVTGKQGLRMSYVFPWLWKVESRRLLWLLGLTFALIVTFQYVELPYSISSLFSSTKMPVSRNSTSLIGDRKHHNYHNLPPPMVPSFSQNNATLVDDSDKEVEVDKIFDKEAAFQPSLPTSNWSPVKENATAPAASVEAPAALPGLRPSPVKDNATVHLPSAKAPAALPGLNHSPLKQNATLPTTSKVHDKNSTKEDVGDASPVVRFVPDIKENAKTTDSGVMSIYEMSKQLRRNRISNNRLAKVHHDLVMILSYLRCSISIITCFFYLQKPKWVTKPDLELLQAKHEIENAPIDDKDPLLYAPLYHNVSIFKR